MFKKPFKQQNAHSISNKDRKRLKASMACFGPEVTNFLLDDKVYASSNVSDDSEE